MDTAKDEMELIGTGEESANQVMSSPPTTSSYNVMNTHFVNKHALCEHNGEECSLNPLWRLFINTMKNGNEYGWDGAILMIIRVRVINSERHSDLKV